MSQYLQRLNIASVEEVGVDTNMPHYTQHVDVVEVVDRDGNPWEPVPGPDPWDELAIVTRTTTSGSTTLGSILTGTLAEYTGGEPPVEELYQWQSSPTGSGDWAGLTDWSATPTLTYTTVLADNGKYIRFASKATDASTVVYGSGAAVGPMVPAAITVSQATKISNGSFVNPPDVYSFDTITPVPATFAGGFGTITVETRLQKYSGSTASWQNINNWSSTPVGVLVNGLEPGTEVRAQSRATDATGQTKTSSSPAPKVGVVTTIGTVTTHPADPTTADAGELIGFTAACSGNADPLYTWQIRSGPAAITSSYNFGPSVEVTINAGATSGETVQVQVDASDPSSSDSPQSTVVTILVN